MLLSIVQIGCIVFLSCLAFLWARSQWRRLPPGPPGLPFLGNIADMPKDYEWRHWAKHKDIYGTLLAVIFFSHTRLRRSLTLLLLGPVSSVCVLGQPIIILNSLKACEDLLEKRSAIYSGRPVLQFAGEMYAYLACAWSWSSDMVFFLCKG